MKSEDYISKLNDAHVEWADLTLDLDLLISNQTPAFSP